MRFLEWRRQTSCEKGGPEKLIAPMVVQALAQRTQRVQCLEWVQSASGQQDPTPERGQSDKGKLHRASPEMNSLGDWNQNQCQINFVEKTENQLEIKLDVTHTQSKAEGNGETQSRLL